jgi:hypothetical protein
MRYIRGSAGRSLRTGERESGKRVVYVGRSLRGRKKSSGKTVCPQREGGGKPRPYGGRRRGKAESGEIDCAGREGRGGKRGEGGGKPCPYGCGKRRGEEG